MEKNIKVSIVTKKPKTQEVYNKIKNMIIYNYITPGQKLIYQDLANKLNVSITPIVQALNRLLVEYSNIVHYEPNKGYYIGEITETEATDLYQTREALEVYSIPFIVKNIKSNQLKNIRKEFRKHINKNMPNYQRILLLKDIEFHLRLVEFTHNEVIQKVMKEIFEQIYIKYQPKYLTNERIKETVKEHKAILNAIEDGDTKKAIAYTKKHIYSGMTFIVNSIHEHQANLEEAIG
jgi:DNA-binding GntR family transcriptional regulator